MPTRLSRNPAARHLDATDRALLRLLEQDARAPVADLARHIGLSGPSTSERLRRLEAQGVIARFTVQVDARALGYTLQAIVRVKPLPGQLHLVEEEIRRIPEFVECDKVTGDDCFICRLFLRTIEELDEILSTVGERAETSTAIVKATPVERRLPPLGSAASSHKAEPGKMRRAVARGTGPRGGDRAARRGSARWRSRPHSGRVPGTCPGRGACGGCRPAPDRRRDAPEQLPRRHFLLLALQDLGEDPRGRRRDLDRHFVGLELDQRLVLADALAHRLQPAQHLRARAFGLLGRDPDFHPLLRCAHGQTLAIRWMQLVIDSTPGTAASSSTGL